MFSPSTLVQVGVKPLIREGLNYSILMALRDTRHIKFEDSLLRTIQTSLSSGPVHFDCFPNFTVSLHDPHIKKDLTLNIKNSRTLMVPGTKQLALIYRVHYKCIRTNLNVQALNKKPKEETTHIQTTAPGSQIQVSRTLKWTKVSFPQDWTLQNENYSFQIQHPTQTPDLDFVQQLTDGTVRLSFDQSRFRLPLGLYQPKMQYPILLKDRPTS